MKTHAAKLPRLLAEIEEVAGRQAALAIAEAYGGRNMHFPAPDSLEKNRALYADNWLVRTVGAEPALAILRAIFPRGGRVDIPMAVVALGKHAPASRKQFVQDHHATLSISEMAAYLGVSDRAVRRIKQRLRDEGAIR